jgi:hypothetical protein
MTVTLADKLALIATHWDPHVIADCNDNDGMPAKFRAARRLFAVPPHRRCRTSRPVPLPGDRGTAGTWRRCRGARLTPARRRPDMNRL